MVCRRSALRWNGTNLLTSAMARKSCHTIEGLLHESNFFPTEVDDYPLGIGTFGFVDYVVRDAVVGTTFELDEDDENMNTVVSFVPHDAAINMRMTSYGPQIWLLYVGFPHDY